MLDENGHAFKVRARPNITSKVLKAKIHRKSQKTKRRSAQRLKDDLVRIASPVSIAPESTKLVRVQASFKEDSDTLIVEKKLATNGGPEDIYGCADTMITGRSPFIYVSNFSKKPVVISAGHIVSQGYSPTTWLDKKEKFTNKQLEGMDAHANLLRGIINTEGMSLDKNPFARTARSEVKALHDASRRDYSADEPLVGMPVEL